MARMERRVALLLAGMVSAEATMWGVNSKGSAFLEQSLLFKAIMDDSEHHSSLWVAWVRAHCL